VEFCCQVPLPLASDRASLCRIHHREIHSFAYEVAWWQTRAIDPVATARMLWISTRRIADLT